MSYGKGISYMNKEKKNIVLFDMDGTLTEPRRSIEAPMVECLKQLSKHAEIGVVTGSDYNYVMQQMKVLFETAYPIAREIHWLPCNGTKYYRLDSGAWEQLHGIDMRVHLGEAKFAELMKLIIEQQCHISDFRIPLTGHFINYRGSMINWSPIGRNAGPKDRKEFIKSDLSHGQTTLRHQYLTRMKLKVDPKKIKVKLGGDTSFDIYPVGWDKTYCLKFFEDYNKFFIGDRCYPDGNDYELFRMLSPAAWETSSPSLTERLIKDKIYPLIT